MANEPRFADTTPARIVPMLADGGTYMASESSVSRPLREAGQNAHRGRAKSQKAKRPAQTYAATAPSQVWCWDMTYLPTQVRGQWFYLFLILDHYSREIVGWEVHAEDEGDHTAHLVHRTALAEGVTLTEPDQRPVLHGDNGATIKSTTVIAMLHWLGIKPSYSRPRVSDNNAFVESHFRTAKYRPEFPAQGFKALDDARQWARSFVRWYNLNHCHSGIRYVSPAQRHAGQDRPILAQRHTAYLQARERKPSRWSCHTRNWEPIEAVAFNPEHDEMVSMAVQSATHKKVATA